MGAAAIPALGRGASPSESGWLELALTRIGTALDRAMLAGMRLAFAEAIRPARRAALETSARPYVDPVLQREPRRFFAFLDAPVKTPAVRTLGRRDVPGGEIVVRELDTAYEPFHASDSWPCCVENARLPFEHWMHRPATSRGVVLALHGFTMGRPWIDGHVLMAPQWFGLGFDVVMPILPFHGPRAPRWARYSGEAFGSWDVGRLNEAVRQAVHDVDLVRRWLVDAGSGPVGLVGLSLGGYLTALVAELCPDVAFAIPVAAPSSLAWLPQRLFGFGRFGPARLPIAPDILAAAYRVHSPLTYPLAIPRSRTFIVGGLGDGVVPPEQVQALWRHWGEPAVHWFNGGHTTPFGRAQIMSRLEAHLRTFV
jgi:pimeloyl-ACP methyl ester carboxylesterase